MHIELMNGRDNFRPQHGSPKRVCEVNLHVCPPKYDKFVYIHVAKTEKWVGMGESTMLSMVPASSRMVASPGTWWNNRYDMIEGTMVLVEYKVQDPIKTFSAQSFYMLLVLGETAPLHRVTLPLPPHIAADVSAAYFTGRFHLPHSERRLSTLLTGAQKRALSKFMDVEPEWSLEEGDEYTDLEQIICEEALEEAFRVDELEPAIVTATKASAVKTTKLGKTRFDIRRVRKLKIK